MQEEPTNQTETVTLPTGGSIPGIPGTHAPGRYIIDWIERTLTPVVDAVESVVEHVEEAISPARKTKQPSAPAVAPMPTEPVDVPEIAPNTPAAEPEQANVN